MPKVSQKPVVSYPFDRLRAFGSYQLSVKPDNDERTKTRRVKRGIFFSCFPIFVLS